jgi:hypothetical protein
MIYFKEPQFPARYRIDGVDLYDVHELNRHGQMLQELALSDLAKREWVGLTDEDIAQAMYKTDAIITGPKQFDFAKELEAKLREKNT